MFTIGKRRADQVRVVLQSAQDDVPEAIVVLDPITPKMRRRALSVLRREVRAAGVDNSADLTEDQMGDVGELLSFELMRLGIVSVDGIVDEAGEPFDLTPDLPTRLKTATEADRPTGTIDDLLADEFVFEKLDEDYVRPDAIRRAEKNALSGSPNGTSGAATPGNDTANLAAKPKRRGAAKRAPTRKTPSKRKPAKASGKR